MTMTQTIGLLFTSKKGMNDVEQQYLNFWNIIDKINKTWDCDIS